MNLNTRYLGLDLPHPFIVAAGPIGGRLDRIREAEDAGAAAIVMPSLFEEQFWQDEAGTEAFIDRYQESFAEAATYFPRHVDYPLAPEKYIDLIRAAGEAVDIPVIASLNGVNPGAWIEYAAWMEQAGAQALELNLYHQPSGSKESAESVEGAMAGIVQTVCDTVKLPVAVKLSPFISSPGHLAARLQSAGASGLVLFNRFYQPDIDIENLETVPLLRLSDSTELLLRLRWLAALYGRHNLNLAATGGIHTRDDAIKALMAGADCLQMMSALLKHGLGHLRHLRQAVGDWMEEKEYKSLTQMKGSMSHKHSPNPEAIERANYLKILQSWSA